MYITPNTTIKLLSDVPLEPDYVHTLYFASSSAQSSYFNGKVKYTLTANTYQRYDKGVLRVQKLADTIYDVNYMMFQNAAYGTKWFYAFVDKVEYVNDVTSAVYYHIDELQTWLFNFHFNQCFIERQHSTTDVIGDNILAEPVEVGEYVYSTYSKDVSIGSNPSIGLKERAIIVAVTDVNSDSQCIADGQVYDGIYGACKLFAYDFDHISDVNALINEYAEQNADSIVSIYMIPKPLVRGNMNTGTKLPYGSSGALVDGLILDAIGTSIDGYVPKNQKLFTYPYNYQSITTGNGEELALRYEFFVDRIPKVNIFGCISQPVQVVCCPTNYKNVNTPAGGSPPDFVDEKIVLTAFPICSWNIDTWRAWVSQNAIPTILKVAGGAGSIAIGMVGRGEGASMTNASIYALNTATDLLSTMYKASIAADQTRGNISSANALYARMDYTFHHGRKCINAQQAAVIDSFFTRFGYAYNKVGTPNIHARTSFTYIKTLDCTVHGSLPADSEKIIENAFNSGITFWVNPSSVGDYSVSNLTL